MQYKMAPSELKMVPNEQQKGEVKSGARVVLALLLRHYLSVKSKNLLKATF